MTHMLLTDQSCKAPWPDAAPLWCTIISDVTNMAMTNMLQPMRHPLKSCTPRQGATAGASPLSTPPDLDQHYFFPTWAPGYDGTSNRGSISAMVLAQLIGQNILVIAC